MAKKIKTMKKISNEKLIIINAGFNQSFWNGYCWVPDQLGNWVGVVEASIGLKFGIPVLAGMGWGLAVSQLVCQYVKH